tara:strand:+ start:371 stop:757 length:387 start_codon:yes stop_codon:yes gene_type:complete
MIAYGFVKQLLITIAAVVLVGCGESEQSVPQGEMKPVDPVAVDTKPEPARVKAPEISILTAAFDGNIEIVKQHLAAGADVNAKRHGGRTPLHEAARPDKKEIVELLIAKGADVNAKYDEGETPLDLAI